MTELKCPKSAKWLLGMFRVLPENSRGKLAQYSKCREIQEALREEREKEAAAAAEEK